MTKKDSKLFFSVTALAALSLGMVLSAFVPAASTVYTQFAMAVTGVVTAYLAGHVAAQHVENLKQP